MSKISAARNAIQTRLLPTLGPFAVAGGNLSLSLIAARSLDTSDYGTLSFVIVVIQFLAGLSNALVVTPLTVGSKRDTAAMLEKGLPQVACINAAAGAAVVGVIALALHAGPLAVVESAILAFMQSLRWTSRGFALAHNRIVTAFQADIVLGILTLVGSAALMIAGQLTLYAAILVIIVASVASLTMLPTRWLFGQFSGIRQYQSVWMIQSRWSFLGVVSTEAVSNAFSYTVTAIAGAAAFAPIAFATLFWRPFSICVSALTPIERMKASHELQADPARFPRAIVELLLVLGGIVLVTATGGLFSLPFLVYHFAKFDLFTVFEAMLAMSFAMAMRALREPLGILWQAQGRFRSLSLAIMVAGGMTALLSIVICLWFSSALAPIAVAIGEAGLAAYLFVNRRNERRA